jgi:hypothetical protein
VSNSRKYQFIIQRVVWLFLFLTGNDVKSQVLEFDNFRQQVLRFHPLVRQADLNRDQAKAGLLRAKGGFDPKLFAEQTGKTFNGKTYFQYTEAGLKYPTWAGLELKGSYNLASGIFVNSESQLPADGQAVFGLNWTLGRPGNGGGRTICCP